MIDDTSTGVWLVDTETSRYVIDLEERHVLRIPGMGAGDHPDAPFPAQLERLRMDGLTIPLLALITCEVDKPAVMVLDVRRDGVSTVRTTTTVRRMKRVRANDPRGGSDV